MHLQTPSRWQNKQDPKIEIFDRKHRKQFICIGLLFPTYSRLLTTLKKKPKENIVGKGENAGNQHFLLYRQCFQKGLYLRFI